MLNLFKALLPDPDQTARRALDRMAAEASRALDRMAAEASRARMIRQAGLEAVRKELEK